jgi:hypothetical protein
MRPLPIALLLVAASVGAQEEPSVVTRFLEQEVIAFGHFRNESWDDAVAAFERQIAIFPDNPRPYYNIACCYALQRRPERTATWLHLAVVHGWRDAAYIERDPDFDLVRDSEPFRSVLRELERVRRRDPAPLPQRLPPESVPGASSAASILVASALEARILSPQELLLEERQYRERLFEIYDRRLARLTRYLAENGDARDADVAAHARVETAMLYLSRAGDAEADRNLRETSARTVLTTAEEFLRGWPGSRLLPDVRFWRAHARARIGDSAEAAERLLRTLAADHPRSAAAPRAWIEICTLLADADRRDRLREGFAELERRYGADRLVRRMMRRRLTKARLLAKGLPKMPVEATDGLSLYVFVTKDSTEAETRLPALLRFLGKLRLVVLCIDEEDEGSEAWLRRHAPGALLVPRAPECVEALWLVRLPTLVLARGSDVVAVDPTEAEIAELVESSSQPTAGQD